MNFHAPTRVCLISFWLSVSASLLMGTVSSAQNELKQLGEKVRRNFKAAQTSSCIDNRIDVERHFSWIVRENGLCDDNLLTNFKLEECYKNSSYGTLGHYCLIELLSEENASNLCQKKNIKIALCVPSSCNEKNLEKHILDSVRQSDRVCLTIKAESAICYKLEEKTSYSLHFYVSFFLLSFVIVVVISSVYDLLKNLKNKDENASWLVKFSKDFSIVCNYRKLTDTSLPNEKPCIHLISILCLLLITIGQHQIFTNASSRSHAYQMSASRCIDVLFLINGFLAFYYGFKPMQKGSGLFLIVSVVFRWLRMIPTFCILALFVMYILPNFGNGIVWKHQIQSEANICESNFWSNVFCIKNFADSNKECLSISWYIRLDLQLSVLGGVLLLIFTKKIEAGLIALSFIVICTYVFTAIYSARDVSEMIAFQTSVYSRIPPYLIGFAISIMLRLLRKHDFTFSNAQKVCILAVGYGLKISIALCDWLIPLDRTSNWSIFTMVLYAGLSRWFYVLFEASMILIYYTCGLGLLNKIIEFKIIIPLGRLSYVVLLTSTAIQLFHTANLDGSRTCTHYVLKLVTWILVDIICAYLIGFLIHLFFEAPFSRISKRLLKHLLNVFAKPVEKTCVISLKDEPDEDSIKSINRKHDKKTANGVHDFVHENEGFVNDEDISVRL